MKIDLFIPCYIDQISPSTAFNTIKVLEKAGCQVNYNVEQTCCGQAAFNAGHWDEAREVGVKFLSESNANRYMVSPGGSCVSMIRNSYDALYQNSSHHNKFRQLQKNIFELSEFLVDVLKITELGSMLTAKVTYMDACQALQECKIKEQPRLLLEKVAGLQLVELKHDTCCGFGGSFSIKNEAISVAMGEQKITEAIQTGAEYIVSTDFGCLMHLDSIIKQKNYSIKTLHLADLLAMGL
ncbi:MAG: (Fe-S)-binding protein [Bacteroidia bacterium]|jgi:L-lactate dehydrogenase complex protein LldE|nr:(Fe-S)-binding protein [Bacteroidia bacterium]